MKLLVYGGSFNPPHKGHVAALERAVDQLCPDKTMVIPAKTPPHKQLPSGGPNPVQRLEMTKLAFSELEGVIVSDMELLRDDTSYTVDTLRQLAEGHAGWEIVFLMGTDMLLYMEKWREFEDIFRLCTLAVLSREDGEDSVVDEHAAYLRREYDARIVVLPGEPLPMDSTGLRSALCCREGVERLPEAVYEYIICHRLYDAKPQFAWLRQKSFAYLKPYRVPHVVGCEEEAVRLANYWGEDPEDAAEAAILHDITKKLGSAEQLRLCQNYGIMADAVELRETKLLHSRTGACLARELFGVSERVFGAIEWHTTGRVNMNRLEKIIYMADYIEPTRDFDGVEELRRLAYLDLDQAMILGLEMSLNELSQRGAELHPRSVETLAWLRNLRNDAL